MRFLFVLIMVVMALAMMVFASNNVGTSVPVTLLSTHPDVPVFVVVFLALTFGAVLAGVVAITEGARTRLENRRLRREVRKLETELNFLRTEPRIDPAPALPPATAAATGSPTDRREPEPPSAPVYDTAPDGAGADGEDDPEDDMYAGGRAV